MDTARLRGYIPPLRSAARHAAIPPLFSGHRDGRRLPPLFSDHRDGVNASTSLAGGAMPCGDMGTGTPWTVSLSVPGPVSVPEPPPPPSVDRLPPVLRRSMPRIGDGGYFVEVVPGCMRADRRRSSLSIVPVDRAGLAPGPVARVLHAIELPVIANRCSPQPAPSSVSIPWQAMIHS